MSHATAVTTALKNNSAINTALTGGIYSYGETGRLGVSREYTPDVYDTDGSIKPCCVVKSRDENGFGVRDDAEGIAGYRQIIEIWLYDDGDNDYSALESIGNNIFALINGSRVNSVAFRWNNTNYVPRDVALDNALCIRLDFQVIGMRGS